MVYHPFPSSSSSSYPSPSPQDNASPPFLFPSKLLLRSLSSKLRRTLQSLAGDVAPAPNPPQCALHEVVGCARIGTVFSAGRVRETDDYTSAQTCNGIHSSASDALESQENRNFTAHEATSGLWCCRNTDNIKREQGGSGEGSKYDVPDADVTDEDDGESSWRWNGAKRCGCFANRIADYQERLKRECEGRKADKKKTPSSHVWIGECDDKRVQHSPGLPDDVVEICLARASFSTVMSARIACRKWRALTMSPHFLANREKLGSKKPWFFLFGISRDGISRGEIHALDASSDRWHSMQTDMLKGRFLFSVVCLNSLVYIIGGCSNLPTSNSAHDNKNNTKTHRGVLVFDPFACSWTKCRSMGVARAMAVAAVFEVRMGEVAATSSSTQKSESDNDPRISRNLSGRDRSGWFNFGGRSENLDSCTANDATAKPTKPDGGHGNRVEGYGLVVVGGRGMWKEALFSAEIYDPVTDTWRDIAKLPPDHGVTSAGVVCNGFFYAYSEIDRLAAYDFRFNTWSNIQISNSLTRLHEYVPKLVCCNGRLILQGVTWGSSERERSDATGRNNVEAATRTLWELDPSSQTWQQICKHPDAPLDWNAVSVSEGSQIYGIEMFKIFGQVLDFVTVCDVSSSDVSWKRMSRMRLGNNLDVSSCFAKSAAMVQL